MNPHVRQDGKSVGPVQIPKKSGKKETIPYSYQSTCLLVDTDKLLILVQLAYQTTGGPAVYFLWPLHITLSIRPSLRVVRYNN